MPRQSPARCGPSRLVVLLGVVGLLGMLVTGFVLSSAPAFAGPSPSAEMPAAAQDEQADGETAFIGEMTHEDTPIPGVAIRVETPDGELVGEAITDDEGTWRVPVPEAGDYVITIDPETLQEGVALRDPERTSTEIGIRDGIERQILFPTGPGAVERGFMEQFAQRSLLGVKFGLLVGMMAVGLSLIFGTTGIINFAHGELVSLGAVVTWVLNAIVGLHLLIAAPIGIAAVALFAGGMERFGFRPLRRRRIGTIQLLIITIGLSLILQHLMLLAVGSEFHKFEQFARQTAEEFGPFRLSLRDAILMVLSAGLLIGVGLLLTKTRLGKAIRAVADDRQLAESSGIDVNRIVVAVWILGGGLAATSGVFLGLINNVQYLAGYHFLLLMFAAIILGGLGAPFGAMAGGLMVGYVSEISTLWLPSELKNAWALVVLILVLLIRPTGLLGRRERIG